MRKGNTYRGLPVLAASYAPAKDTKERPLKFTTSGRAQAWADDQAIWIRYRSVRPITDWETTPCTSWGARVSKDTTA